MNQGTIILTSTGLSAEPVRHALEKFFDPLPHKSVAIVTTAAEGKEHNKYSKLAESQFRNFGFNVIDFIDIENNPRADFSIYSVIYVCGGNTFKLLKYAQEANFKDGIIKLFERGGIYIGVSAGAIILAPTIQIAASVDPEPNEVGIINLEGLALIDFEVHPHYDPSHDKELITYQKTTANKVVRISNSQAIVLTGTKQQVIG
jgi:dipeptidase E